MPARPVRTKVARGLTPADLEILSQPFPFEAYEFFNGFTYIKRDYIAERVEQVDLNYEFLPLELYKRDKVAVARGFMKIKGVRRGDAGMATIEYVKDKNGKLTEREAGEAEKSAVTDLLKRCGWQFKIARELRFAPKVYIDEHTKRPNPRQLQAFKNWHMELTGEVVTLTREEATALAQWYTSDEVGLTHADALRALEVENLTKFVGGYDEAKAKILAWIAAQVSGGKKTA